MSCGHLCKAEAPTEAVAETEGEKRYSFYVFKAFLSFRHGYAVPPPSSEGGVGFYKICYCSDLWQPQQSVSASHGRGGKKSSVGNLIFLKVSQGWSVESSHCFSGMQKSYTGISI